MGPASEIIVLGTAIGAVVFLFTMDYFFRLQEERAETNLEKAREESRPPAYIELKDEGEENIAA